MTATDLEHTVTHRRGPGSNQYADKPARTSPVAPPTAASSTAAASTAAAAPYQPVSHDDRLAAAADRLDAAFDGASADAEHDAAAELLALVREHLDRRTPASSEQIAIAREHYVDEHLAVDDDAEASASDDGAWIQAWVWVDQDDH